MTRIDTLLTQALAHSLGLLGIDALRRSTTHRGALFVLDAIETRLRAEITATAAEIDTAARMHSSAQQHGTN